MQTFQRQNLAILSVVGKDVWLVIAGRLMLKDVLALELTCTFFRTLFAKEQLLAKRLDRLVLEKNCFYAKRFKGGVKGLLSRLSSFWPNLYASQMVPYEIAQLCEDHISYTCVDRLEATNGGKVTMCQKCRRATCAPKRLDLCPSCQEFFECARCSKSCLVQGEFVVCGKCQERVCEDCSIRCLDCNVKFCAKHSVKTVCGRYAVCEACCSKRRSCVSCRYLCKTIYPCLSCESSKCRDCFDAGKDPTGFSHASMCGVCIKREWDAFQARKQKLQARQEKVAKLAGQPRRRSKRNK